MKGYKALSECILGLRIDFSYVIQMKLVPKICSLIFFLSFHGSHGFPIAEVDLASYTYILYDPI